MDLTGRTELTLWALEETKKIRDWTPTQEHVQMRKQKHININNQQNKHMFKEKG